MDSKLKTPQISIPLDQPGIEINSSDDEFISGYDESSDPNGRDEWLLNFELNERGVGRILLPPGLAIFLQSDRVCIMPMGGGLFIKSV
jgi:hypothetical protein